ncbi:MAG: anaerobic ribonucleoside-triphosphate reductase activating protein [bacterium]|nr:anaerobic ribonucleoside-triphosphate reductase activating protein [bacterium]
MIIGGLEKLTLLDYPDNLAAIVFTQGCNFRCHFCYNPMLVLPRVKSEADESNKDKGFSLKEEDLFLFLENRKGKLDGVVITGGEPTLHADLPEFIKKIKDRDLLVKLDSNGTNPDMLKRLIDKKLIDYIAMDIKAPWEKYEAVVGVPVNLEKLQKSVKMIMTSGLPYEFRSTLLPEFHNEDDIRKMGEIISGANRWYLQKFKPDTNLVNTSFEGKQTFLDKELESLALIGSKYVKECRARI